MTTYTDEWVIDVARMVSRVFPGNHPKLFRRAGMPRDAYLSVAYERIDAIRKRGRLPDDQRHAFRLAKRAGLYAAIDYARTVAGRVHNRRGRMVMVSVSEPDTYYAADTNCASEPPRPDPADDKAELLLSALTSFERRVIERHFGFRGGKHSLASIAKGCGKSPAWMSLIYAAAVAKMRDRAERLGLLDGHG